jgi:nitrite reductase/ring-hydroxylating ferredoxin subunit/uncharacterized membrane protein
MQQTMEENAAEQPRSPLPGLGDLEPEQQLQAIPKIADYGQTVSRGVHDLVLKGGEPARTAVDLLHGTKLGHPLHPILTDVTIGGWLFGSLMDLVSTFGGGRSARRAADTLITIGTVSALPTAMSGLADYSAITKGAMTTGAAHGLLNSAALVLYSLSLASRRKGSRALAMTLSGLGLGLILISAWLGGEMVYRYKVGVNHAPGAKGPKTYQAVLADDELKEGKSRRIELDDQPILLYRCEGQVYAISAICAHAGGPLDEGKFDGCRVECPWHQSVYDLRTGRVAHGPATYPVQAYETRLRKGQIEIRLPKT